MARYGSAPNVVEQGQSGVVPPVAEFYPETCSLLIHLGGSEQINPKLLTMARDVGFIPKDELHMTAISFANGRKLQASMAGLRGEDQKAAYQHLHSMAESTEWTVLPTGKLYIAQQQKPDEVEVRRSIIELVECPQLASFYSALQAIFPSAELETPPAHVTLLTAGNTKGIALNSYADLRELAAPLHML